MKGYVSLFAAALLILLLLPIGLLPKAADAPAAAQPQPTPDISQTGPAGSPTEEPSDTAPPDTTAVFRILNEDKVTVLPEREFLIRVLAFEMSPTYHTEALKAQAVAAATYYGRRREQQKASPDPKLQGADFEAPVPGFPADYSPEKRREKWGTAYDSYEKKLEDAVDAVRGITVQKDGKLIDACYFSISNGRTESAEAVWGSPISYLQSVASPGDKLAPRYQTEVTLTAEEVKSRLAGLDPAPELPEQPGDWFGEPTLAPGGTVLSIPIGGRDVPGTTCRELFHLRSACFDVSHDGDSFTFTVRGYGHGVGMSQYGADYLARQGYRFREILTYYYTGAAVVEPTA